MEWLKFALGQWWGITISIVIIAAIWLLLSILFYRRFFKRFYDIVLSGLALIVLSPILVVLTIIGAVKMKGNPFFTQLRPGRKEKIFKLIKFRTMTNAKDENGNLLPDDVRLTKYGKLLRSTSLDELPELINIFIGQMSIIGPRPQLVRDMVFMTDEQRKRHTVRPGLSGLAQVRGRNSATWEERLSTDLEYVSHIGLWSDVKIILQTVFKVFKREGISEDGVATSTDFGDYLLEKGEISREEYDSKQAEAKALISALK